jgi:hypothetical protein
MIIIMSNMEDIQDIDEEIKRFSKTCLAGALRRVGSEGVEKLLQGEWWKQGDFDQPLTGRAWRQSKTKDWADRVMALPAAVVTSPLMGALAVAVKLEDGGPILYKEERVAEDGFVPVDKLRSMRVGADEDEVMHIRAGEWCRPEDDPRCTRVGR